jgi:hypothetical protein
MFVNSGRAVARPYDNCLIKKLKNKSRRAHAQEARWAEIKSVYDVGAVTCPARLGKRLAQLQIPGTPFDLALR